MNNFFNKIDDIDLTSILTEDANTIQKELDLEFSGKWENNQKSLSENELELNSILREISDSLAITNEDLHKLSSSEITKLVEDVLDRVEPRWNASLFESVIKALNVPHTNAIIKASKLNEEVSDVEREAILMSSEVEDSLVDYGVSDITELDLPEQKEVIEEVLTFNYGNEWGDALYKAVAKEVGAFGLLHECEDKDCDSIECIQKSISELKQGIDGLEKTDNKTFEYCDKDITKAQAESKIKSLEKKLEKLSKNKNDDLDNAFGDNKLREAELSGVSFEKSIPTEMRFKIYDFVDDGTALYWVTQEPYTDEQLEQFAEALKATDFTKAYVVVRDNSGYDYREDLENGVLDVIEIVDDEGHHEVHSCSKNSLNESISTTTTVDNIDQESKDKATIKKAIEIAGDKTTIDNDMYRKLRLELANKDYDVLDRLKDYALVRGEDVIYTWLRAEDSDLKEAVNIDIVDGDVNVTTDTANIHVAETGEPAADLAPVEEPVEVVEPVEVTEPVEDDVDEEVLQEPETLSEAVDDVLDIAGLTRDDFDNALSDKFPEFDSYVLNPEANTFDLIIDGNKTTYKMDLTDNAIEVYPADNTNVGEDDIITLITLENNTEDDAVEEPAEDAVEDNTIEEPAVETEPVENDVDESEDLVEAEFEDNWGDFDPKEDNNIISQFPNLKFNGKEHDKVVKITGSRRDIEKYIEDKVQAALGTLDSTEAKDLKNELFSQIKECDQKLAEDSKYNEFGLKEVCPKCGGKNISFRDGAQYDDYYEAEAYCNDCNEVIDSTEVSYEDEQLESEGMQVSDIPAKNDQDKKNKRIELAKFESEDKVTYRVSYLTEDDEEIIGWDLDVDSDEEAISALDDIDGLLNTDFNDTGIDGVSSSSYNDMEFMLNIDGDQYIMTVTQTEQDPIILKGTGLSDVLNQLISWYISTKCSE